MSDINVLRWVFVIENAIILSEKKCSYVAL